MIPHIEHLYWKNDVWEAEKEVKILLEGKVLAKGESSGEKRCIQRAAGLGSSP